MVYSDTRPATSWGAVVGGWIATIGASVIFAPAVAALVAAMGNGGGSELALAVPVVLGLLVSYLVGGWVAGYMAGYRTSWHGMMTAFFSLFVLLALLLLGAAAQSGLFAGSGVRSLADVVPGVRDLRVDTFGNAVSFGALLGFLAAIFGGWLGGLLAPERVAPVAVAPTVPSTLPLTGRTRRVERSTDSVRAEPLRDDRIGDDRVRDDRVRDDRVRDDRIRESRPRSILRSAFSPGRKGGERMTRGDVVRDEDVRDDEVTREGDEPVDEMHTGEVRRRE